MGISYSSFSPEGRAQVSKNKKELKSQKTSRISCSQHQNLSQPRGFVVVSEFKKRRNRKIRFRGHISQKPPTWHHKKSSQKQQTSRKDNPVLPRDKCLVTIFWSAPGSQDS